MYISSGTDLSDDYLFFHHEKPFNCRPPIHSNPQISPCEGNAVINFLFLGLVMGGDHLVSQFGGASSLMPFANQQMSLKITQKLAKK